MDVHDIIDNQKKEIERLYEKYTESLECYLSGKCDFDTVNSCGDSFFGYLEHCAAHNRTVDELNNTQWNQWLAETCIDVLHLILAHYKKYREVMNDNSIKPSSTAFASMQRIVKAHDKRSAKEIRNLFVNEDMPVYGFDNKGKEKLTKAHERIAAFSFGILLVILFIIIAIFIPNPTNFQYTFFRIILSAAVAGVVSFIPGFIEVKISNWVRAGGALAVFVIVYYVAPAAL
ncbi:hypothetical protein ACT0N4_004972 [Escherichia coli]